MKVIFIKEIRSFFSSLIGYMALGVFLLLLGLMTWVFPDYSILDYGFASMDSFFEMAPIVFLFLIPAITMRAFAEEWQTGTYELLITRPVTITDIIGGKYFAAWTLVIFALIPTLIYWFTVYQLGSTIGNMDNGGTMGSYFGLVLLSGVFVSIGLFCSALTSNQIVAFLLGATLCFIVFYGFKFISTLPVFIGKLDDLIQQFGIEFHYRSISRGILDSRDILYFLTLIFGFLYLTFFVVQAKRS